VVEGAPENSKSSRKWCRLDTARALGSKKKTRLDFVLCLKKKKKKAVRNFSETPEGKKEIQLNKKEFHEEEKEDKHFEGRPHANTLSAEDLDSEDRGRVASQQKTENDYLCKEETTTHQYNRHTSHGNEHMIQVIKRNSSEKILMGENDKKTSSLKVFIKGKDLESLNKILPETPDTKEILYKLPSTPLAVREPSDNPGYFDELKSQEGINRLPQEEYKIRDEAQPLNAIDRKEPKDGKREVFITIPEPDIEVLKDARVEPQSSHHKPLYGQQFFVTKSKFSEEITHIKDEKDGIEKDYNVSHFSKRVESTANNPIDLSPELNRSKDKKVENDLENLGIQKVINEYTVEELNKTPMVERAIQEHKELNIETLA